MTEHMNEEIEKKDRILAKQQLMLLENRKRNIWLSLLFVFV